MSAAPPCSAITPVLVAVRTKINDGVTPSDPAEPLCEVFARAAIVR
jgi:hypothetical protein